MAGGRGIIAKPMGTRSAKRKQAKSKKKRPVIKPAHHRRRVEAVGQYISGVRLAPETPFGVPAVPLRPWGRGWIAQRSGGPVL